MTAAFSYRKLVHVPRSQVWPRSRGRQFGRTHLHIETYFDLGRIHRKPGQALCGKRGWYERPPEGEREFADLCPRCNDIAERAS